MTKYIAIGLCIVALVTCLPIWAGYAVDIAVAAHRAGLVRQEFAGQFGEALLRAPILIACAIGIAACLRMGMTR